MDERVRFVAAWLSGDWTMTELCASYAVSRKTGYKWLNRYRSAGPAGLAERSHAALKHGLAHPAEMVEAVLSLRRERELWGPRKLRAKLQERHPDWEVPSASTIGEWLRREGLTRPPGRRTRCPPYSMPLSEITAPNDVWTADYKGWFRVGDGQRCDPLTVNDAFSRFGLVWQVVAKPDHAHARVVFDALFCEYGLPQALRTDNGPPFASQGAGGLSRLSVWWLKLGIKPERIARGKPQQNGRHERMHGTLKEATASPPAATLAAQQRRFDAFRQEYNCDRPHEALGQKPPATLYVPSSRPYPCPLCEPEYGADLLVRRVRSGGEIKWRGTMVFISEALSGEPVGIAETEEGHWSVTFADVGLGFINRRTHKLCRRRPPP